MKTQMIWLGFGSLCMYMLSETQVGPGSLYMLPACILFHLFVKTLKCKCPLVHQIPNKAALIHIFFCFFCQMVNLVRNHDWKENFVSTRGRLKPLQTVALLWENLHFETVASSDKITIQVQLKENGAANWTILTSSMISHRESVSPQRQPRREVQLRLCVLYMNRLYVGWVYY